MALARIVRRGSWTLVVALFVVPTVAYSAVAISLAPPLPRTAATLASVAWVLGAATVFAFVRPFRRALLVWGAAFAAFAVWWSWLPAPAESDWQPDVARPSRVEIQGDLATVRDVRNFEWTSASDAVPRWEDRTYDLSKLESAWFAVSYWDGNRAFAHTMLSFGFEDGRYLALSVEVRKQRGEVYSAWRGSFKQFELIYVLADERDVFRVRTNHRGEDLYLYPFVGGSKERLRSVLMSVLEGADDLAREPQWYMTVGRNCTTSLVRHLDAGAPEPMPRHRWLLMNGYSDELAYDRGAIPHDRPFDEVRAAHRITDLAKSLGDDPDFSRKIRVRSIR